MKPTEVKTEEPVPKTIDLKTFMKTMTESTTLQYE